MAPTGIVGDNEEVTFFRGLQIFEVGIEGTNSAISQSSVARFSSEYLFGLASSSFGVEVSVSIFRVVNAIIRPLMVILTIPITIVTLGVFLFVINALMLWLAAALVPGFRIQNFSAALFGSIILTILNILIAAVFGVN